MGVWDPDEFCGESVGLVGTGVSTLEDLRVGALSDMDICEPPEPFAVSLREAIQIIWVKLSQLEQAPACIPPCGHQPAARVFQCATCRLVDCQFPVDCPVQDVWVHEDEAITLHCDVPFAVPPELQVTWMFAKDIRTQDLALFEELQRGVGEPPSLTVQDPTLGTIACRLGAASETLARKYFYLNGPPGNAAGNLRSLPDPSDSQAPHRPGHQGPKGSVDHRGLTPGSFPEDQNICSCSSCIVHGM
ncbi:sperm acrosome membrane-associated protein 6-like [Numida meleagris]|uniref:sperm acrosome membrane-associated protein 6-like n=1 Tax=Numida meleagris TaxID=8996 RepID=UPI000B3E319B|nr:sperm acrosome membrane-associated protein 6-like [Numida meleagris]